MPKLQETNSGALFRKQYCRSTLLLRVDGRYNVGPPKFFLKFFRWYCHPKMQDYIEGDLYYQNYGSIGQVWAGGTDPESSTIVGNITLQYPAATILRNNYQHYFKHVLMAWWITDYTLSVNDNKFTKKGEFIDEGVLDMLSLKMLKGTHASLSDPHSIVLSKSTAEAIFGTEDPMNKTLKIDNRIDVQVTGVYEDIPGITVLVKCSFFLRGHYGFHPTITYNRSNEMLKGYLNRNSGFSNPTGSNRTQFKRLRHS